MSAPRVRADYDALKQISQRFCREAEAIGRSIQANERAKQTLEAGDWAGEGARAFYSEMNSQVVPAMRRLVGALEEASRTAMMIGQVMHRAEDEAAAVFRTSGSAIPAGLASGLAGGLTGGSRGAFDTGAAGLGPAALRSGGLGEAELLAHRSTAGASTPTPVSAADVDKYFDSANLDYQVGKDHVQVRPFFQISAGKTEGALIRARILTDTGRTDREFKIAVSMAACGRPSLKQLQMVTQEPIDVGKLDAIRAQYPGLTLDQQIKKLQFEYDIGMDCAGYVQQAFLAAHGGDRARYGFKNLLDEDLWRTLPGNRKHFDNVSPERARPGDLLILNPADEPNVGHTTLVRDQRPWDAAARTGVADPYHFASTSDELHVFEVESSFGAGDDGDVQEGGVQRRQWLYNKTQRKWAEIQGRTIMPSSNDKGPYGHPLQGVYHPKR